MTEVQLINNIKNIGENWSGRAVEKTEPIPQSGSNRRYFRIFQDNSTAIVAYNPDKRENQAFTSFTRHFKGKGLHVPMLLFESEDGCFYVVEDLGNVNLYDLVAVRKPDTFNAKLIDYYKKALVELIRFQLDGHKGLDYSLCYPRHSFDAQSIQWDLNYFKYYYLKLACISFDEQLLEDDYQKFTYLLLVADQNYFMFRDFQSRNIMIHDEVLYFIDYQGGRKGPLQYDVASLLYQAKADLPEDVREDLLNFYLYSLESRIAVDRKKFIDQYYAFVLVRTLQVLGAYGYRGFFERKSHFIGSIPFAINNLKNIFTRLGFLETMPELKNVLLQIIASKKESVQNIKSDKLHVSIFSFSYRKGIPEDTSGNGGGFVFDCRAVHNPGRYEEYKTSTGKDQNVIDFFAKGTEMNSFLESTIKLVDASVEKYISRKFNHLQVSYGCTGGQHRSVFCAENMARHLREKYDVEISLRHREQEGLE
ncbi:MAG: phosphotransferase [Bacteroidales bacterium]|nr:phosphotransferase [Bacteroidales bacterium]MCF8457103.1 phosphotransferase [Bacteroidales bacterium]